MISTLCDLDVMLYYASGQLSLIGLSMNSAGPFTAFLCHDPELTTLAHAVTQLDNIWTEFKKHLSKEITGNRKSGLLLPTSVHRCASHHWKKYESLIISDYIKSKDACVSKKGQKVLHRVLISATMENHVSFLIPLLSFWGMWARNLTGICPNCRKNLAECEDLPAFDPLITSDHNRWLNCP